jgi:putative DNA primase/helicase
VFTEVSARSLDTSGYFKALTGGDQITAERKGQHPFNFVSYAKQIYSANQIPMIRDDSDALFRRWVIIRFEKQFTDNANPHLTREITTKDELSGVLNWALTGFLRLYQNGKFTHNKSIDEVRDQYNRLADPVRCFYEDCLHFDDTNNFVSKEELFDSFKKYVKFYQLPQVRDLGAFCKQLYNFFPPTVIDERTMINNIRKRGFRGVTLREVVHL